MPEVEVETWWTSLFEPPEVIIGLYHDHGTSEQFHSELKSDMDVERLPSGSMKVNALILMISMLAFNTLRFIGLKARPSAVKAGRCAQAAEESDRGPYHGWLQACRTWMTAGPSDLGSTIPGCQSSMSCMPSS